MQNMKAYKDGNRLVLVLENADEGLEGLIKTFLCGGIESVQHLAPPEPMAVPQGPSESATELPASNGNAQPRRVAKFVQNNQERSTTMRTIHVSEKEELKNEPSSPKPISEESDPVDTRNELPNEKEPESIQEIKEEISVAEEAVCEETEEKVNKEDIERMNIFAVSDYLRNHNTEKLQQILYSTMKTGDLEFILHTKTETQIRGIATEMVS